MTTRFCDTAPLAGVTEMPDGSLRVDARAARTGVQMYLAREIGLTGDRLVPVYRPEDVVFDRRAIEGFASVPVTVGHPAAPVTADNWRDVAVGETEQDIVRDGEHVRVSFRVRDAAAVAGIKAGLRDISMGYYSGVTLRDGVAPDGTPYEAVQTGPIQIDHLALVPRGRAMTTRIGDEAGDAGKDRAWGAAPITDARKEDVMATRKIMVDGLEVETTDAGATAIARLQKDAEAQAKRLADAEAAHKAALDAKAEEVGALKAALQEAKDALPTPAALERLAAERAALVADAKRLADGVETAGKSAADIRRAAVAARLGDAAMTGDDGKPITDAEVAGMFRALARTGAPADPARRAVADSRPPANDDGWGRAFATAGVQTRKEG